MCIKERIENNPIQCDMTGAGRSSLPASQTTIYYIQTGRPPAISNQMRFQLTVEAVVCHSASI